MTEINFFFEKYLGNNFSFHRTVSTTFELAYKQIPKPFEQLWTPFGTILVPKLLSNLLQNEVFELENQPNSTLELDRNVVISTRSTSGFLLRQVQRQEKQLWKKKMTSWNIFQKKVYFSKMFLTERLNAKSLMLRSEWTFNEPYPCCFWENGPLIRAPGSRILKIL